MLDILAKIDDKEYCNIELQIAMQENIIERILYYWARIYVRSMKKGNDYKSLKRTIQVLITNFEVKDLESLEYHTKWEIIEEKGRKKILTKDLEVHIIEMPKIYKLSKKEQKQELIKWIYFFENPENKKGWGYMQKEEEIEEIKEAREKLREISEDEKMQRIAELRQKAIWDERAGKAYAINEAKRKISKKMLEKGYDMKTIKELVGLSDELVEEISEDKKMQRIAELRQKAIWDERAGREYERKEGIKEGRAEGKKEKSIEIAKKMKEKTLDIKLIEELTGLTKSEIEKL